MSEQISGVPTHKVKPGEASPCPFCLTTEVCAAGIFEDQEGNTGWAVVCTECGATGPGSSDTPNAALDAWNKRTAPN